MSDVDPHAPPAPRVLVDLAALERVDLQAAPRGRPVFRRSSPPPRFAQPGTADAPRRSGADRAALVTIGRLAREARLELCTYPEFDAPGAEDAWRGTWRALLGRVPVTTVPPGASRDALGDDVFGGDAQAGALARLCTVLKHVGAEASRPEARFRQLAARVQGHHLADVFHLWSAECAGCSYWLTLDATLEPFVRERVVPGLAPALRCEPVLPDQLLSRMGVQQRDEVPGEGPRVVPLRRTGPPTSA